MASFRKFLWLVLVALGLGTKRHWHILFAIVAGVLFGLLIPSPALTEICHWVGEGFIRLITMIVVPLVISSLIVGVSALGDRRQLGRLGSQVLGWFLLLMVIATVVGASLAMMVEPGTTVDPAGLSAITDTHVTSIALDDLDSHHDLAKLFLDMIPANPFHALAGMQLVPVILFTLIFGTAISNIGDAGKPLVSFFESVFTATMKMTEWIMVLSVPGVFALTFYSVAVAGPEIFLAMAPYVLIMLSGLLIQIVIVFPIVLALFARIDPVNMYRAVSEAIMVGFGTASSSATLPVTIACCERRAGISNRIASFVLPTGASLNKTATAMFEAIAVVFLAQAYGLPLDTLTVGIIVLFAIIATIGAPGVPAGGLITMSVVIRSLGPEYTPLLAGVALLWPIDRILDMCRTAVNVMSSCTVAAVVAAKEGELNRDVLNNHETWTDVV